MKYLMKLAEMIIILGLQLFYVVTSLDNNTREFLTDNQYVL